jgi:hypothetical protein
LDEVGPEQLNRLVGLVEDTDLEFKSQTYEHSDREKREAAADLAPLANAQGGLLVFGIEEDGAGVAKSLAPLDSTDDFPLWLDQVSASRISPVLPLDIHTVTIGSGVIHLVSVPPSVRAPHAVISDDTLRYPIRAGRHRRFLSESEVADAYARRFVGIQDRSTELQRQLDIGSKIANASESPDQIWMLLGSVPDVPGELHLSGGLAAEWTTWVASGLKEFPCFNSQAGNYRVALGYRSLVVHDSLDSIPSTYRLGGQLSLDGSGVLVFGYRQIENGIRRLGDFDTLYDEFVVGDLINGVGVLAQHAQRCGATGDVQASVQLLMGDKAKVLSKIRDMLPGVLPGTRPAEGDIGPASRTLSLEGSAAPGADRLAGVRMLAGDLFSAFGLAAPLQISQESKLVQSAFHPREILPGVKLWAEQSNVELVD